MPTPMKPATHQTLMRELGALMNRMAGVNPDDDVAVLTETLKCVRTLNPRTTTTTSHVVARPKVLQRCVTSSLPLAPHFISFAMP